MALYGTIEYYEEQLNMATLEYELIEEAIINRLRDRMVEINANILRIYSTLLDNVSNDIKRMQQNLNEVKAEKETE